MLQVYLAVVLVAVTAANICTEYNTLYQNCLPNNDWICESVPKGYKNVELKTLQAELMTNTEWLSYIQTCKKCIQETKGLWDKKESTYLKNSVCRTEKVPVEYVWRPIIDTISGLQTDREACEIVFNNLPNGNSVQKIYRVECYNGKNKFSRDRRCQFEYGPLDPFYCKPTNYVKRNILVYCPSDNGHLRDMVVNIPTACSCVKVGCKP